MGEIADSVLDGTLCQVCGEYMGAPCGHVRICPGCFSAAPFPTVSIEPPSAVAMGLLRAVELGVEMRKLQNAYFRTRGKDALVASKKAEKAFDDAAKLAIAKARG